MYNIVYTDEDMNIIFNEYCNGIKIKNDELELQLEKTVKTNYGCNPNHYFIFDTRINTLILSNVLSEEDISKSLDKEQFKEREIQDILAMQEQYIQQLEERIKNMETSF